MRPILCVVDLSDKSLQVLEVAVRMAYAYKSYVAVLFPYRLIGSGYKGQVIKLKEKLEQEANEKFLVLKSHVPLMDQLSYEFLPQIGFAADSINSFVATNKVDFIVIGQHQATQMNEANQLTLQNLISHSKLPFTIVPDEIDAAVLSS
jgi:nucleotide-binding universal stress UspA family protein